jgi:hypothetical protein
MVHSLHDKPDVVWYLPIGQSLHTVWSTLVNWPSLQESHEAAPYEVVIWPCGHAVQSCAVLFAVQGVPYLPGVHAGVG